MSCLQFSILAQPHRLDQLVTPWCRWASGGGSILDMKLEWCLLSITLVSAPILGGVELCQQPNPNPFAGASGWEQPYSDSIDVAQAAHMTPPDQIPFDRLWVMDDADSVTFEAPFLQEDGSYITQQVHLENPVLVTTWVFSAASDPASVAFQKFKPLQAYRPDANADTIAMSNLWVTLDGNMKWYLDEVVGMDRSCLNPMVSAAACKDAVAWGLPTVGMPYALPSRPLDMNDAYASDPGGIAWWQATMVVAIADRDAFVRPSYNPTVNPTTDGHVTDNGVPIWDAVSSSYRLAGPGDGPIYAAQQQAVDDFVGIRFDGTFCTGPDGFAECLVAWQQVSWFGDTGDPSNNPYAQFPYSSIGMTGDWQLLDEPGIEDGFFAQSEFILNGNASMYVIGDWSGSQYLGIPQEGQVPWCDSCAEDLNMDGVVGVDDLLLVIDSYGGHNICANFDKETPLVNVDDLLLVLGKWGECPGWPEGIPRPADCP